MDDLITDEEFDSIAESRDEFRLLFRSYSDATSEFIDADAGSKRFARLNGKPDRRPEPAHAISIAHTLNSMYLDALLMNKRIRSCLAGPVEARSKKAGNEKLSEIEKRRAIEQFIIHSMRSCADHLSKDFEAGTGEKHKPECSVLCCGILAGLGLLLSYAVQSNPPEIVLPNEQLDELAEILNKKLNLSVRFSDMEKYLDGWINAYWRTQEIVSTFSLGDAAGGDIAAATFWTLQTINLYRDVTQLLAVASASDMPTERLGLGVDKEQEEVMMVLRAGAASVAEARVMAWIVGYQSGLVQSLSRDTLYWLQSYLMNSSKLDCNDICAFVFKVVIEKFFVGGCFSFAGAAAAAAVNLSDSSKILAILLYCDLFRRVVMARSEVYREIDKAKIDKKEVRVYIGIAGLPPSMFTKHYTEIAKHLSSLKAVHERKIWYRGDGAQPIDQHFWRICLISSGIILAEEILDRHARRVLGVQQFVDKPKGPFPWTLQCLNDDVIDLIGKGGEAKDEASYSMILYGPPGSAKTSLAKKIAYDLRWPFLEIGSRDFLRQGSDKIDAEADRIFRYCGFLRDVAILFDELEELILERETAEADKASRLLTTSMLPRIQELRDQRSAVFIFATNRLKSLDIAATRLGRFDIIKYVAYPDLDAKKAMLNSEVVAVGDRYPVLKDALKDFILYADIEQLTRNMAFGDLKYVLGQIRSVAAKKNLNDKALGKRIVAIFKAHKPSEKIHKRVKEFEILSKRDRPQSSEPT
jgi:ATPase family protein associated with various cellular activities (AAA)